MSLAEKFLEVWNSPDPKPFLFLVGQKVRVNKTVLEDGQTPLHWAGAKCKVLDRKSSGLSKSHWYKLEHENGHVCEFREEEIDMRYAKK